MILIFLANCRFYAENETALKSFETDSEEFKLKLKAAEDSLGSLTAALETIDANEDLSGEEYISYLEKLPINFFKRGSENAGYYYTINEIDDAKIRYYSFSDGQREELAFDDIEDDFNVNGSYLYKWRYIQGEADNAEKAYLVYTMPLMRQDEAIGYAGVVFNLYFVEKSVFGSGTGFENTYLLNKDGDFAFGGGESREAGGIRNADNTYIFEEISEKAEGKVQFIQNGGDAYLYTKAADEIVLVRRIDILGSRRGMGFASAYVGLALVLCFVICGFIKEKGEDFLNRAVEKYKGEFKIADEPDGEPKYRIMFLLMAISAFTALMCLIYSLASGRNLFCVYMLTALAAAILVKINLSRENEFSPDLYNKLLKAVDWVILALPGIFLFFARGIGGEETGLIFFFSIIIYFIDVFYYNSQKGIKSYYAMIIFMLIGQLAAVPVWKVPTDKSLFVFTAYAAFIGLAVNAFFVVFKGHTKRHNNNMQSLVDRVKNTQSMLIQNERMTTLGRLMAGISHEINTPIGAIKASADTFNAKLVDSFRHMINSTKDYSENDLEAMFTLIELSFDSVKKMLTTSELRKGRENVYDMLVKEGIDDDNAYSIAYMLSRIEICDLDKISENKEIFKKDNIEEILKLVCDIFFLITGTNTIQLATNKVSKIMYALRAYSNASVLNTKSEFNITESIDNILTLYTSQFNSSITINRFYEKDIPPLVGNAEGLGQVCTNLIQNAFYAIKNGGTLNITVKTDNGNVIVDFTDTGCGIPEENIDKIFEPLFTTKPLGEGSGLGLGICKKIIEDHNGKITVKSRLGEGSSFTVSLPLSPNKATDREE